MGPAGIGSVAARIATIESRFAPPQAFRATLAAAAASPSEPGTNGALPSRAADTSRTTPGPRTTASTIGGMPTRPAGVAVGGWAARLPAAGRAWSGAIEQAALRHGVEPELLAGLVWAESGFQPDAISHAGAIGLAQLMPATAAGLGVDPHDPQQNLDGGARFLRAMLDQFGSNELALAAYNAGPGRVARTGGIPDIRETRAYVPKVLGYYEQLRGGA